MATNFAKATYTEVYDCQTQVGVSTLISLHTPISSRPFCYLEGFFKQFERFKYNGMQATFIPVSTLPADPLQVSYEAGEPTIDPRDLTNPILHRNVHGQQLQDLLQKFLVAGDGARKSSADFVWGPDGDTIVDTAYYQALGDSSWSKSHVQRGFTTKWLTPLVYPLGTNMQMASGNQTPQGVDSTLYGFPNLYMGIDFIDNGNDAVSTNKQHGLTVSPLKVSDTQWMRPQFTSMGAKALGWLDTMQSTRVADGVGTTDNVIQDTVTYLPKLPMHVIVLPPAYKTEMYFRLVIRHSFSFARFHAAGGFYAHPASGSIETQAPWYDGPITPPVTPSTPPAGTSAAASVDISGGNVELRSDGVQ